MPSFRKPSFVRSNREGRASNSAGDDHGDAEYVVENLPDRMQSSRNSRFELMQNQLGLDSEQRFCRQCENYGLRDLVQGLCIHPENRWYRAWQKFILIWAIYSSFFTPMEIGFFRGLPKSLFVSEIVCQIVFLLDIILEFFVAYRDSHSYKMIYKHNPIARRYIQTFFLPDLLGCLPWDIIYKVVGRREEVRHLLWIRVTRVRKIINYFHRMEKDIRIKYLFTRIIKLIWVEYYCTHTAACIFYYLATSLPEEKEGYTWIGSLKLGDYSYSHFRDIDLWKRYTTSLYFAIVTMTTVGYGDIHAVNLREMIFIMIYVSFDMILGAYLVGNMTALIVKGSKTERYRDRITDLTKYMNRNGFGRDLRNQIKGHLRLQYESSYTDASVLRDIPISIRAKISQTLYKSYVENVPLFKGCSAEFINQIVTRVQEEFFLPGEVIMEQGNAVDQLYIVCDGVLEEFGIASDGSEETVAFLEPNNLFGEISILCNIPQPYIVRVCELCRLLRIGKQSFSNILAIYFHDGRRVLSNLLEGKESNLRVKQLESDIAIHISKQESEFALRVISLAYHGDLYQLKSLIRSGADPNKKDYDGRSALHIAASRGFEDIVILLLKEGVDVNAEDHFGNTPLLEAIKNGNDRVASLLSEQGAVLKIDNTGTFLCSVVVKGETDLLKRVLSNGIDPNSRDYDNRTPLHIAASQGLYLMTKLLVEAGANVFSKDKRGNTPLDEAWYCRNKSIVKLIEEAKIAQLSEYPESSSMGAGALNSTKFSVVHVESSYDTGRRLTDLLIIEMHPKKCTVFPFHPWNTKDKRRGIVMWVPSTIEELIQSASKQLELPDGMCILSEDGGMILDTDMIVDGQKLYLTTETD